MISRHERKKNPLIHRNKFAILCAVFSKWGSPVTWDAQRTAFGMLLVSGTVWDLSTFNLGQSLLSQHRLTFYISLLRSWREFRLAGNAFFWLWKLLHWQRFHFISSSKDHTKLSTRKQWECINGLGRPFQISSCIHIKPGVLVFHPMRDSSLCVQCERGSQYN